MATNLKILLLIAFAFLVGEKSVLGQPPYIEKIAPVCFTPQAFNFSPVNFLKGTNDAYFSISGCGFSGQPSDFDIVFTSTDSTGTINSQTYIAGSCNEFVGRKTDIVQTHNLVFFGGSANSFDGNIEGFHGPFDCSVPGGESLADYLVSKFDLNGTLKWAKCYGGEKSDAICSVLNGKNKATIIVSGFITVSANGDYSDPLSPIDGQDIWLVEIDTSNGSIIREKCFGTSTGNEAMFDIKPTHDKGYIISGLTSYNFNGFMNPMLIKIDSLWNQEWMKILYTPKQETETIVLTDTISGSIYWLINSNETDSIFHTTHYVTPQEWDDNFNYWLVKLNSSGDTIWKKCVGTPYYESMFAENYNVANIIFNDLHEIVITGYSYREHNQLNGTYDIRFLRVDTLGNILQQKNLTEFFNLNDIISLGNGSYLCLAQLVNDTCPYQLVTLGNTVGIEEHSVSPIRLSPNPSQDYVSIDLPVTYNKATLQIYNMQGQLVKTIAINGGGLQRVDTAGLPNGIYQLLVSSNSTLIGREKLVVTH